MNHRTLFETLSGVGAISCHKAFLITPHYPASQSGERYTRPPVTLMPRAARGQLLLASINSVDLAAGASFPQKIMDVAGGVSSGVSLAFELFSGCIKGETCSLIATSFLARSR